MAMSTIDESQRNAAKVAGIAYLLSFAIVVSAFYGIYVRLVVPGNTAVCAFDFFISPGFGQAVNLYSFDTPIGLFELATSFWLVFKGLKQPGLSLAGKASI